MRLGFPTLIQAAHMRAQESNALTCLPEEIWRLTGLEALYVGRNSLQYLPECLTSLPRLAVLDSSHNSMKVQCCDMRI